MLETLPRPELAPSAAPGRPRRHPGHWVRCTCRHSDTGRAVYWNSETRQLSLDAPAEGAHFTESVAEQADFDAMWAAADRSGLTDGSSDTRSSDEEPQWFERGQPDRIAETLAASAPGGACSESWGWGISGSRTAERPRDRRALLQDKRKAARFTALVAQLRQCVRQRYMHGLSNKSTGEAVSIDPSRAGKDDPGSEDGGEGGPLGEAAAAAIEAVAVDCATMVTSLMSTIVKLRTAEAESSASASRAATGHVAKEENEGSALCRILSAGRLLALPEQVRTDILCAIARNKDSHACKPLPFS